MQISCKLHIRAIIPITSPGSFVIRWPQAHKKNSITLHIIGVVLATGQTKSNIMYLVGESVIHFLGRVHFHAQCTHNHRQVHTVFLGVK